MSEKKSEIIKIHGVVRTIPSHQQLVKANKLLKSIIVFLMAIVVFLGFFFLPNPDLVAKYKKINPVAMALNGMNPVTSTEVNTLKGQLVGLVSGSIESKLKSLEESIKSGQVNHSLGTIEDLKGDLKVLRTYSEASKKPEVVISNVQLADEVSHLKHLIYATLVSCGLMFVAVAGVWIKYRKRLPYEIKRFLSGR